MINRPPRNHSRAEWLIEKQTRARWLIKAQATLERSLQNIRSPDEWERLSRSIRSIRDRPELGAAVADLNRAAELLMSKPLGAPVA